MTLADGRKMSLSVVPEGCVADVMAEGNGLDEVLVQPEKATNVAGNLGKELDVEHAMGDVIVVDEVEDLGLVDVARIGEGMENSVGVQGKVQPMSPLHPLLGPTVNGGRTRGGMGGKDTGLSAVEFLFEPQEG
jgi:hypothetical protein